MTAGGHPPTPCLLLDQGRLDRNIARMEARCASLGVRFRPHLKTAKSRAIAARIPSAANHGITVSTLREAEYFAAPGPGGCSDIFYAVCLAPNKVDRALDLLATGTHLTLAADHPDALHALGRRAEERGLRAPVLLEVDCGEHRSGRPPEPALWQPLLDALDGQPSLDLRGVYTHGGHSYGARDLDGIRQVAEAERDAVLAAAELIERSGRPCPVRSVGSTPTISHGDHLRGITEARAGVFVFHDLHQVGLGSCAVEDVALTVATTVIGVHADHAVIDAGGLALSKDRSTAALADSRDAHYGWVLDADGGARADLAVTKVFQEHGILAGAGFHPQQFQLGDVLRILPNHSCMTAAAYGDYHVIVEGQVRESWPRTNGWA